MLFTDFRKFKHEVKMYKQSGNVKVGMYFNICIPTAKFRKANS